MVRYKLLGPSGLRVSEVALGTMTFGEDWGWGASNEESRRIFDRFADAGGNFVDTSNNYTNGTAERFVGEFIAAERDHFVVATKYSLTERRDDPNAGGNHRKNMMRSIEGSLRRLGTDHVDLLWLRMWDATTPVDEVLRAFDDLVRAGKVLYVGMSDTPAWVVAQAVTTTALRGWTAPVAVQAPWSLADRGVEREVRDRVQAPFHVEIVGDVVALQPEAWLPHEMADVVPVSGEEVVQAEHLPALRQQPLAQVGPQESRSTADQDPSHAAPTPGRAAGGHEGGAADL